MKSYLSGDNCFWDIYKNGKRTVYGYQFFKDGKCYYYIRNDKNEKNKFDDDDVIMENTWSFKNERLKIRGVEYEIDAIKKDIFLIRNIRTKVQTFLIKKVD